MGEYGETKKEKKIDKKEVLATTRRLSWFGSSRYPGLALIPTSLDLFVIIDAWLSLTLTPLSSHLPSSVHSCSKKKKKSRSHSHSFNFHFAFLPFDVRRLTPTGIYEGCGITDKLPLLPGFSHNLLVF